MWFEVDKAGLAALLEARGKSFAVFELVQNAWDANPTRVTIDLKPIPGEPYAQLRVEDDSPEGWIDVSHSYTLFSRSHRAAVPTKRGRFCLGDKLALSLCRSAKIVTMNGSVVFNETGHHKRQESRDRGTLVEGQIRMTREELAEVQDDISKLIPPIPTIFNGQPLASPAMLTTFTAKLQTVIAGDDGNLRPSARLGNVEVYPGNPGGILELGIPVCDADWPWRLNVMQKVPLNMDRNQVTDAFRRALQVAAMNALADTLDAEQAATPWAMEAIGDSRIQPDALKQIVTQRFGERAVIAVPGDPVANATAEANGSQVIHGGAMSADVWANVRKHNLKNNLIPTSSQAFPTPKPNPAGKVPEICPLCKQPVHS